VRIKHVPSGKYLSVDSSQAIGSPRDDDNEEKMSSLSGKSRAHQYAYSADGNQQGGMVYNTALVFDSDRSLAEGTLGSPLSLLFYLRPIDITSNKLQSGTAVVRLEHRTAEGQTLYFNTPHVLKSSISHTEKPASNFKSGKHRGFKICFSTEFSSLDILRVGFFFFVSVISC
jgi:hypothetical protein